MVDKKEDNITQQRYFRDIGKYPLLTQAEEIELGRRVQAGDAEAKRKLILSNLKLVINIAKSYASHNIPFLDLIEEGNMGLIKAVGRFDPEKGFRFSTYASWWIKQAIARAISNYSHTIRIPIHIFQLMTRYVALEETLAGCSIQERARKLSISEKRYRMIEELVRSIRALDLASGLDTYTQLASSPEAVIGADPEKIILKQIEHEKLTDLLERLSEREKLIIKIRYGFDDGEPHTLAETGERVHVSRERVRQLEMRALHKLRSLLEPADESQGESE
ncbi:MAG: sigma-70 family RNA polymerase sigma factor [bacterium]|nr:MAG: sigma-70 family RNA polymerase sigma factor [bacterium]